MLQRFTGRHTSAHRSVSYYAYGVLRHATTLNAMSSDSVVHLSQIRLLSPIAKPPTVNVEGSHYLRFRVSTYFQGGVSILRLGLRNETVRIDIPNSPGAGFDVESLSTRGMVCLHKYSFVPVTRLRCRPRQTCATFRTRFPKIVSRNNFGQNEKYCADNPCER